MNYQRIIEILETYRPGEGLESDPEIREALELAARDPELQAIREQIQEFDAAFGDALNEATVPAGLQEKILHAARLRDLSSQMDPSPAAADSFLQRWLHPATFGIAAAIIIMLALTFTFWTDPGSHEPEIALAQDPISSVAHALYTKLNPAFKSKDGAKVKDYLQSNAGFAPGVLPGNVVWDRAFACDVLEVEGHRVSIICFMAPDNSPSMHLFTFLREEFPDVPIPARPSVRRTGKSCCAQWGDAEKVHVLYSDKGEDNLRAILKI